MAEKSDNPKDGVRHYVPVLVAIISTFGLTLGGNHLLLRSLTPEIIAPDRFTGTDAKEFERRFDFIERELGDIRAHVNTLPPRELTERVLKLELELRQLRRDLDRCCNITK